MFAGFGSGFFFGILIYIMILAITGWQSVLGMVGIAIAFGIVGILIAYFLDGTIISILALSIIGSWIFTRSAALFFGGLPDEQTIWKMITKKEEVDFSVSFWYYIALYFISLILTSILENVTGPCLY